MGKAYVPSSSRLSFRPPVIYYNGSQSGICTTSWLGSGTTIPYDVHLHLGPCNNGTGLTLEDLKTLFISNPEIISYTFLE
jgi:hypothetical protein